MRKEWEVVDVLRHYRHDWLNKLQLIKGNLDIGRVEKVEDLIREIIQQSKNESDLSNLNSKILAERLLTFNWEEHPYVLFFEILTEEKDWKPIEDKVMGILNHIFLLFDNHAKYGYDNQLIVTLKDFNGAELEVDYHGQLFLNDEWHTDMHLLKEEYTKLIDKIEWDENGMFLKLRF